jgi:hypothetical protein
LAVRINALIHDVRSKQLAQISSRSTKELRASVKATANDQLRSNNIEQANRHFASVSNNLQYNADNVYAFRRTGAGTVLIGYRPIPILYSTHI